MESKLGSGPTEVRLENLTHVHTAGNTQRVEHDLDRRAVGKERHVFDRQDLGNHTLVPVATGHLVANADHSLGRDVNLDHLQHAAAKFVTPLHAVEFAVTNVDRVFHVGPLLGIDPFDFLLLLVILDLVQDVIESERGRPLGHELRILAVGQRRSGRRP